ncbi:hypothetical protein EYF80_040008 [Liparis tanakae]|uniref:Uncharacterized protein n=1 Tax=Liparis tanakae TaxID=230148 RepID=A0A4Z2GAG2_9TELE|nr:hypothetical protein EYF80_040008 [Liparis tanakae]
MPKVGLTFALRFVVWALSQAQAQYIIQRESGGKCDLDNADCDNPTENHHQTEKNCTAIWTFPEGSRSSQNSARPLVLDFLQRSASTDTPTVALASGSSALCIRTTSMTRPS